MRSVLDTPEFTRRIGGPLGQRAKLGGVWFDPAPLAIIGAGVVLLLAVLRQVPCQPNVNGDYPNSFLRLCYTDISTLYLSRDLSLGEALYQSAELEYPVIIGYVIGFTRWLTGLFMVVEPTATPAEQVQSSQVFFLLSIVLLSASFMVTVVAHLKIGDNYIGRSGIKLRAWDAVPIALSPIVLLNAFVNWDLLVVMFTSLALLCWTKQRPLLAGVFLGLGCATKLYPILLLIGLVLLCARAAQWRALLQTVTTFVATWVLVNLPILLWSPEGWGYFWKFNADRGADLGSFWYVLSLVGINVPYLSLISFLLMAAFGLGVAYVALSAPRRPRLAQVVVLLLIVFLIFNKVYSPQYALWLLPFVVLARPKLFDISVWTLGEVVYWFAIWGFLEGIIGMGTGAEWLYWVAVLGRIFVQLWFALRVIDDIYCPWDDLVRQPFVDDPHGGVFNNAVDKNVLVRT